MTLNRYTPYWVALVLLFVSCCVYSSVAAAEEAKRQEAIREYQTQLAFTKAARTSVG